jgi:hypothetical protein
MKSIYVFVFLINLFLIGRITSLSQQSLSRYLESSEGHYSGILDDSEFVGDLKLLEIKSYSRNLIKENLKIFRNRRNYALDSHDL